MAPKKFLLFRLGLDERRKYDWIVQGEGYTKAECATLAYNLESVYIWRPFKEQDADEFIRLLQQCIGVSYKIEEADRQNPLIWI